MTARVLLLIGQAGLLYACTRGEGRVGSLTITEADTLVSTRSELLGSPSDVAVDAAGRVYVADYALHRVVVLDGATGEALRVIGGQGSGPVEFQTPRALSVEADTLRVVDAGNGRVQVLSSGGAFVRSYLLPVDPAAGQISFAPDGKIAFSTEGVRGKALATVVGPSGGLESSFGKLLADPPKVWNFTEIKREISKGRIPAILRNSARPVLGRNGDAWIVLLSEAVLQRYDSRGRLLWSRLIETPEIEDIRRTFFRKNREEKRPSAFYPISYVSDAALVGNSILLLVNSPEDMPAVLLLVSQEGVLYQRVLLPGARGARHFAPDARRQKLYLAVPSAATVLSVPLPAYLYAPSPGPRH